MSTKSETQIELLRRRRHGHIIAGAIALWLLLPLTARGGGVVTNCTEAALRAAMAGGGTVTFACDGTITLASTITNDLDVTFEGASHNVTISGNNAVRVFFVPTNSSLTLKNLKVANGLSGKGAGIFNDGGTLTLSGVQMSGNLAANYAEMGWRYETGEGGAVYNRAGNIHADTCTFFHNTVYQASDNFPSTDLKARGGAIRNVSGVVTLQNCLFSSNRASGGPTQGPVNYSRDGSGGAINNSGWLTASRCSFFGNAARGEPTLVTGYPGFAGGSGSGGAIYNEGALTLIATTVASNSASGGSGGLGSCGCAVNCPGAPYPGGPGGSGGSAYGGGLANAGSASAVNCTFAWNSCVGGAGGPGGCGGSVPRPFDHIHGTDGGNGGGGGDAFGGAIWGSTYLTNCTLAFNSVIPGNGAAGGAGGGAMPPEYSGLPGADGNTGAAGGAGLDSGSLVNTLLTTNAPGGNGYGALTDLGYNLSSDASCNFTNVGSLNNTDPLLGPLADNGGPALTMALLPGSPAIDAGDTAAAPTTDQRGHPRPVGLAADLGAYEYGTTPKLLITSPQPGTVEILLYDASGPTCRLFKCSALTGWQCVATNQIGTDGTSLFQEACSSGETQRFYRVALP